MIESREFRNAMGKFATGITVVTVKHEEEVRGMTLNAFMSVSLDPKLIAISVGHKARMHNLLRDVGQFGLSILSSEQELLSMIFAGQVKNEDNKVEFSELGGVPVIEESLVNLSCRVISLVEAGDHTIFLAEVDEMRTNEGDPVLFYSGKYRNIDNN